MTGVCSRPVAVVTGVSASGKTTVGARLAAALGVPFQEGDDLHPAANRAKMAAGHPLDDTDRVPWLAALTAWIRSAAERDSGGVLSCSALRRAYRDQFRATGANVYFLQLSLDRALAAQRISHRAGHFMPPALLDSQYALLEPLRPDEPGSVVDASGSPAATTAAALRALEQALPGGGGAVPPGPL
ncbi:gluconokinase [Kitasatospora sp. NPDC090091]|uniref:gluconokinase n=1 Tax=Kitasatospora sp. NPDC090091 TaxID=3364081 RepID=UPI0038170E9B